TIRLSSEVDRDIETIAKFEDTDKSKVIREIMALGIKEKKLQEALFLFTKGKISMWKAATLCGLSLWEMMDIISERKITVPYGINQLEEDLKGLKGL
ncbi:MAG: UPF0175 family protein, partial [Nanoarchaeota archaeon]